MPSRVSIRIGLDDKPQVVRDFADIGDAGEVSARRIAASYDRAVNDADAALARLQKATERMASVAPGSSGATSAVNPLTGGGYDNAAKNARASAAALTAELERQEQEAHRLLAATDPLYAAQMRYNSALDQAISLQKLGIISDEQFARVQTGLKGSYDEQVALLGKNGLALNQNRIAQMELEHAVRGSMDALAAGAQPAQVFAMHLGMLAQAAQISGGSMGKFGEFLSGPWGIALTVAVLALGPLSAKLLEAGSNVDSLVDKLRKEAQQQRDNDLAHQIFAQTLDGVTEATRRNEDALKKIAEQNRSAAEQALAHALAQIQLAKAIRDTTAAELASAQARLAVMQAQLSGPGHQAEVAAFGIQQQESTVTALQEALTGTGSELAKNQADVLEAMSRLSVEAIGKMAEPVERIKSKYATLIEQARAHANQLAVAARAAGDEAKAQALVTTELQKQLAPLKIKEQAEIDAEQARNRKGPANAGGSAIFDAQIASFFDIASKYRGDSETANKGALEAFFHEANLNLDPEKTAWCAAFVNAVLAAGGVHGTGSLAAKSFLNYGKDDTHSPQKGDVVVLRTGPNQDHVGFLDSIDKSGNVRVLAGNTSNKVAEATYAKGQVLAIRRPPTPGEQQDYAQKQADAAQREQATYDDELAKLHEQYLSALQRTLGSADQSAIAQEKLAAAEHDAEATKIANNLAEGKYGEATSEIAKTRARELNAANDVALAQKQAAITIGAYVKSLDRLKADADQRYQYQLEDLRFADEFARSSDVRRKLAIEMLDIQYQQKLVDLQILKAKQIELQQFEKANETQAAIDRLPQQKAEDSVRAIHGTMSPWQQYLDQLPQQWGEVRDAIEKDGVSALDDFNNGLADAIANGKSLGDVMHHALTQLISDAIKLSEQLAESAIFGKGVGGSGSGSGGGAGGFLGAIMSLFGSGGGGGMSASDASFIGDTLDSFGFAGGTASAPGGYTWVGEFGKELVRLPRGSKVTPASESRRIAAANDGGIGVINIPISIDATGADPAALARTNAELQQLKAELPGHVVAAYYEGKRRNVIQ